MGKETQLPITAGTVVYQDDNRLKKWVEHWKDRVDNLLVLDQCRFKYPLENKPENLHHEPVVPSGNPDLHWGQLMAMAMGSYLLWHGVDEFISEKHLKYLREQIVEYPEIKVWYIRRKNMVNGKDVGDLFKWGDSFSAADPDGYDWQPALVRLDNNAPAPLRYGVKIHTHPQVTCGPHEVVFMNPDKCWILHERTIEECKAANAKRNNFLTKGGREMQARFIAGLEKEVEDEQEA